MTHSNTFATTLRRTTLTLGLLTMLATFSGCAEYQLRIADSDPLHPKYEGDTLHNLFWGVWVTPEVLQAKCKGVAPGDEAINDVLIKSNYLYDLISVLTLGIWMPIDVEYRCKAPPIDGC